MYLFMFRNGFCHSDYSTRSFAFCIQMEEITGKRGNTSQWIHDGYEYHIDTTHPNIFRCSTRSRTGCLGVVRVDVDGLIRVCEARNGHQPNPTILEEARMRREMLQMAAETNISLKEIFDTVCRRFVSHSFYNLRDNLHQLLNGSIQCRYYSVIFAIGKMFLRRVSYT